MFCYKHVTNEYTTINYKHQKHHVIVENDCLVAVLLFFQCQRTLLIVCRICSLELQVEPTGTAPEFTVSIQNCEVKEGKVASFSCRVIGEPTPELTWQLNGEPLAIEGRYTVVDRDGLQVLQVHNVLPSDTGVYKVTATNSLGDASCTANLTVEGTNQSGSYIVNVLKGYAEPRISTMLLDM